MNWGDAPFAGHQLPHHLEAVEAGHLDVEQEQVRGEGGRHLDGFEPVGGLPDHLHAGHGLQQEADLLPRELLVDRRPECEGSPGVGVRGGSGRCTENGEAPV